ncbi:peptidoglycan/xylan/chitin deacetylase (PgdA/CDA1 family) [Kitasatospora gansuensis]|uniref:Peptidoglycan/xylan/chitin deacetylase (PgdA/CDA1 family) n=1 Tax=Kitasatospora gansuensis TaxID=258050 RepID=A0A7W7WL71_9ACTN|nr:polysaccharide deacetylase family protein [Kitasatospora gansuensis]MBB4951522.1 peptidoglycan/xylan/chitin deacetylase (PgdA/CDA1 family) [Kitasatospora gansuensis]
MTADRRSVLRTAARLAAVTAVGALSACAPGPTRATGDLGPIDPPEGPAGYSPLITRNPAGTPAATAAPTPVPSPPAAVVPVTAPLAPGTPVEVVNGPRGRAEVALTFHGEGDPAQATALLERAEQHGVRLTVLAVGRWLDQQPQMAERILRGGHELGNHTQNHLDINAMTPDQAHAEIAECAERLRRLTGSIGRWFRPSATQYANAMVREQARLVGYEHCLSFDVDPRDYSDPGADLLQRRLLRSVQGGSVVALHMGHQGTVDALPAVLDGLQRLGLRPVTASQLCT